MFQNVGSSLQENFQILQRISIGGYGEIYLGLNKITNEYVAIKMVYYRLIKEPNSQTNSSLVIKEAEIYNFISKIDDNDDGVGFPRIHWIGSQESYNIMVLQLLGPSLEELLTKMGGSFPIGLVCQIGMQIIPILQKIHEKGIIHLDIKPSNFLVGMGQENSKFVYIIDFGLAKSYIDVEGNHVPYAEGIDSFGTELFASFGSHLGIRI